MKRAGTGKIIPMQERNFIFSVRDFAQQLSAEIAANLCVLARSSVTLMRERSSETMKFIFGIGIITVVTFHLSQAAPSPTSCIIVPGTIIQLV